MVLNPSSKADLQEQDWWTVFSIPFTTGEFLSTVPHWGCLGNRPFSTQETDSKNAAVCELKQLYTINTEKYIQQKATHIQRAREYILCINQWASNSTPARQSYKVDISNKVWTVCFWMTWIWIVAPRDCKTGLKTGMLSCTAQPAWRYKRWERKHLFRVVKTAYLTKQKENKQNMTQSLVASSVTVTLLLRAALSLLSLYHFPLSSFPSKRKAESLEGELSLSSLRPALLLLDAPAF